MCKENGTTVSADHIQVAVVFNILVVITGNVKWNKNIYVPFCLG